MSPEHTLESRLRNAQEHLLSEEIDGWLLYDYRGMNPIFADTVGAIANVTRPCWLWVPVSGAPMLLVSYVDQGRFGRLGLETLLWVSRSQMRNRLRELLRGTRVVAMEYSRDGALPRVSWVDAGTVEMVRGLGVEVVSSADTVQYATQRWSEADLLSHREAAGRLDSIVQDAFQYIGERLSMRPTEYDVAAFIRSRFREEEMEAPDGPIVAVNEHGADPHFDPTPANSHVIGLGDWVLIDLWARMEGAENMYADITWTGYVGDTVPSEHREVFEVVVGARDAAVAAIAEQFEHSRRPQGWEIDKVARDYIGDAGYGERFSHRLGHSIGREVHGNAVNLDSWETHDTRRLIPGIATSVEPGIYLPGKFGVRSEIDVYISEEGPIVTTAVQREPVMIGR
jgi:Xaa-Pro dipeptidase